MILKVKTKVHKTKVRPANNFYWIALWLTLQHIWLRFSTTKLKNNRGEIPWNPSGEVRTPNIFLNRPSISSPTHLVLSLYDKVEKMLSVPNLLLNMSKLILKITYSTATNSGTRYFIIVTSFNYDIIMASNLSPSHHMS